MQDYVKQITGLYHTLVHINWKWGGGGIPKKGFLSKISCIYCKNPYKSHGLSRLRVFQLSALSTVDGTF